MVLARVIAEASRRGQSGFRAISEEIQKLSGGGGGKGGCTYWLQFLGFELEVFSKLCGCPPNLVLRKTGLLLLIKHKGSGCKLGHPRVTGSRSLIQHAAECSFKVWTS